MASEFAAEDLQMALDIVQKSKATGISQLTIEIQNRLRNQQTIDAQDHNMQKSVHDYLNGIDIEPTNDKALWYAAQYIVALFRDSGWEQRAPEVHENA